MIVSVNRDLSCVEAARIASFLVVCISTAFPGSVSDIFLAVSGEFRGDFLEEPTCCRRKRSVDNNTVLKMDINGECGADEVGIGRAFDADVTG